MFRELIIPIKLAFRSLKSNIGRTVISLLGIVIGVASVVLVLSFGMGVKNYLIDQVSMFGTDIIEIEVKVPKVSKTSVQNAAGQVGGTQITTFKLDDAEEVAKIKNVDSWYAMIMNQQIVGFENKNEQEMIMGVTSGVAEADEKMEVEEGRMFTEEDGKGLRQAAVLGSEVKNDLFGEKDAVGKDIKIKGRSYRVIGVLKERGGSGVFSFDNIIYVPLETAQKKMTGTDYVQAAVYKLHDMKKLELTILEAADVMRSRHNITDPDDDDFAVNSIQEVLDILNSVFLYVNILLIALTSISLVVGGVGIMNVMYVSVAERTFEIGLKKSVGAKKRSILSQFLLEAVLLTMLGGIFGLSFGFAVSELGEMAAANFGFGLNLGVTWFSALVGIGFSAGTGIIFGYFPARQASNLMPMEALRKDQ